jgi:hypothetical protein
MSATTLRIPLALRARIKAAATQASTSPHAFMLQALEAQTRLAELRASFVAEAAASRVETSRTRKVFAARDVHAQLEARLDGRRGKTPRARKWSK